MNTGERFLIPEHYKFSFLPDKDLREQVNKPFSIFETTEINENVDFSDMDESVGGEGNGRRVRGGGNSPDKEIPLANTQPKEKPEPILEPEPEPLPEPEQAFDPEPSSVSEPERGLEPEPPAEPSPIPERPEEQARRKPEEKGVLMIVAFLIIVISVFFYLGRNNWKPAPAQEEVITEAKNTAKDTVQESAWMLHPDSVAEKTPHTEPEPYVEPAPKPLGQVKIKHGDRLTVIALEYYGNKLFWVYIYQHNKAVYKRPEQRPDRTVIEIPAPESYGIDARAVSRGRSRRPTNRDTCRGVREIPLFK